MFVCAMCRSNRCIWNDARLLPLRMNSFPIIKSVLVYCGARVGSNPVYRQAAEATGRVLSERGIRIIYGGGGIGMMGALADSALAHGGHVEGVIPHFLNEMEVHHSGLTFIHAVDTMHERKALMAEKAGGFIALPGGYGTLDELFEILTWGQLELHRKPIGLLNVNGYYDHIVAHVNHMVQEGFLSETNRDMLLVADHIEALLEKMEQAADEAR